MAAPRPRTFSEQQYSDRKTGPGELQSTVLAEVEEMMSVAFRRHTLDDCLDALHHARLNGGILGYPAKARSHAVDGGVAALVGNPKPGTGPYNLVSIGCYLLRHGIFNNLRGLSGLEDPIEIDDAINK